MINKAQSKANQTLALRNPQENLNISTIGHQLAYNALYRPLKHIAPQYQSLQIINTLQKPRRNRRRSKSPITLISASREREEILGDIVEFEAEEERRLWIIPKEKITENGLRLRRRLKSDPILAVLLQLTPPRYIIKAQC